MPTPSDSDHRLLQDLNQRVKFLQQRIVPLSGQSVAALGVAVAALEVAVAALEVESDVLRSDVDALQSQINVNLIANPSLEVDADGYDSSVSATLTRSNAAGVPYVGSYGLTVAVTNADGSGVNYITGPAVTVGQEYTLSAYARLAVAGSHAMTLRIDWYTSADAFISTTSQALTLNSTTYNRYTVTGAAPATAAYAVFFLITDGASGVFTYWTDGWQFELGPTATALNVGDVGDFEARIATLEAMADPGNSSGSFLFGPSSKANNVREVQYDRAGDRFFSGGQLFVETQDDAPTMLFSRRENTTSITGYGDNTNVARWDGVPINKNGTAIYSGNGADDAAIALGMNLHIPNNGDSPSSAWSHFGLQCINELEQNTTKPPRTILRVTGENGGEIWGISYNSTGGIVAETQLFP